MSKQEGGIGHTEVALVTVGAPELSWRARPMATSIPSRLERTNPIDGSFEPLLDSTEAAALLRIHPKTLQRMARAGEIAGIQIGRFRASVLNSWLSQTTRR